MPEREEGKRKEESQKDQEESPKAEEQQLMLPENGLADASPHAAELISSHNSTSPLEDVVGLQPRSGADLPLFAIGSLGNKEAAELPRLAAEGDAQAESLAPATPVVAVNAL